MLYSGTGHRWQWGACALYAGYPRPQTHTHNIQYLLLFQCNSGFTNATQYYVIHTLPAFFKSGITWKWVVSSTSFSLNPNERTPGIQLIGGRVGLLADFIATGKWKLSATAANLTPSPWSSIPGPQWRCSTTQFISHCSNFFQARLRG